VTVLTSNLCLNEISISRIILSMSEEITQNLPNGDLKQILARLDSIDKRLGTLEEKVDRRLQETRPIWESVLEQLKEVNTRLTRVEDENKDFRRMFRSAFSDISRTQGDLEDRLDKLEGRNIPQ
jgi:chromosome segregation ATPase